MRNLFLRLISLFTIANLLFYSVYPAVNYASAAFTGDDFVDEGGGDDSGSSDEGSSDDSGGGGGGENEGGGGETGSDWDAYSEETPEAATQDPEIPQESFDFAQDQQPTVSTQGGPIRAPGLSYILPPDQETPAAEALATEQQQQAAYYDDLLTSEEQDQLTNWAREDYKEQISQEPVVDDQSQNDALSAYSQSAAEAADREDQEWARERGLPDAEAQSIIHAVVSTLEKGQNVPDDWWQDYGSKLGDLSDGVVDTITSQVREAQERGEQAKAKQETEALIAAQEREEQQAREALDRFQHGNARERAEEIRQAYGLPEGTDPEQILSMYDKAMTLGGVEFRSGPQASTVGPYGVHLNTDLSSFIITDTPPSVNDYLNKNLEDMTGPARIGVETALKVAPYVVLPLSAVNVPTKTYQIVEALWQLPEEQRWPAVQQVGSSIFDATMEMIVTGAPGIGTVILNSRAQQENELMGRIVEKLKDPDLSTEEKEELKQLYFDSLNKLQDVNREVVINLAFDAAGGVPGSVLAQKAAGKGATVAKTLFVDTKTALQVAKQAGTEGLEGVWVGGRQLAADERGSWDFFGLFGEKSVGKSVEESNIGFAERVKDVLSQVDQPTAGAPIREHRQSLSSHFSQAFDPKVMVSEVTDRLAVEVADVPFEYGQKLLLEKAELADRAYTFFRTEGIDGIGPKTPPDIKGAIDALKYDSELFAREGSFRSANPDEAKVEILQALVKQEINIKKSMRDGLEEATKTLDILKDFSVKHGENPDSFSHVSQVMENTSRFHSVDEDILFRAHREEPGLAGLTIPKDGNILVGTWTGSETLLHECIHGCGLVANPSREAKRALNELMGSRSDADRVLEGFVTYVEEFGQRLRGRTPAATHNFGPEVKSAEQTIFQMAENLGVSLEEAQAKAIALTVQERFDEIVKIAGVENVQTILRENPTNISTRFPTNEAIVTPLERNLAMSEVLEDLAKAKGVNPKGSSGIPFWNLLVKDVLAQSENIDNSVLNSASFEYLVKLKLAKRQLKTTGQLDNIYIEDLLKRDIFTPEVIGTPESLSMTTGKTGNAEGEIKGGKYKVVIEEMNDLDIKVPSFVEVESGTTIVPVAIREGSGKVEKVSAIRSRGGIEVYAQGDELPKVKVAAFYDENGNGNWDGREKALPWAGIQVSLTKINQQKTISMLPGWNLITLTALPTTPLTAASLLGQIAKQGGYATTVSKLENGAWKSYVIRGNDSFSGEDFPIEPGQAYFVKNLKRALLAFEGQEFAQPVKVNLADGWNAVGFPKTAGDYTVSTLIDELNTQEAGADAAARWESGLWDSFVKVGESYGENFAIEPNRGYIVRLKKGVELIP